MVGMIAASPKIKGSIAEELLNLLKEKIISAKIFEFNRDTPNVEVLDEVMLCDKLIFSFPLYVDGIPSHLLKYMECIANMENTARHKVYCIINCGFYEGEQACVAAEMMKNFCRQCGFEYCGAMGIGSGGMIPYILHMPLNIGVKKKLNSAIDMAGNAVMKGEHFRDKYISMGLSRKLYKFIAEKAFRVNARRNGVRI